MPRSFANNSVPVCRAVVFVDALYVSQHKAPRACSCGFAAKSIYFSVRSCFVWALNIRTSTGLSLAIFFVHNPMRSEFFNPPSAQRRAREVTPTCVDSFISPLPLNYSPHGRAIYKTVATGIGTGMREIFHFFPNPVQIQDHVHSFRSNMRFFCARSEILKSSDGIRASNCCEGRPGV